MALPMNFRNSGIHACLSPVSILLALGTLNIEILPLQRIGCDVLLALDWLMTRECGPTNPPE